MTRPGRPTAAPDVSVAPYCITERPPLSST